MKLPALVLLIFLGLPSTLHSVFQHLQIHCVFKEKESTPLCPNPESCKWKVDLITCQTLQMHCIENDGQKKTIFCNSSKECGFEEFPNSLMGTLDCDINKDEDEMNRIKCTLSEKCMNGINICTTKEECKWRPNRHFKEIDNARCTLMYNVNSCIRSHPTLNLTETLNCSISAENQRGDYIQWNELNLTKDGSHEAGATHISGIVSYVFNGLFATILIIIIGLIYFKRITCRRCARELQPEGAGSQGPNSGEREVINLTDAVLCTHAQVFCVSPLPVL
ncbi:uncharacterized protein [Hoplias malabaricus]|uniref:uncharacterized protein n=1 Tax=Hoplias malabaricus TaxID=27720 RepID=UPI003461D817